MSVGDPSQWDDFFEQQLVPAVLGLVIATWDRMPKPGRSDLEGEISLKLYAALRNGKDRNKHPFLIRYEDVEVDTDLAKVVGRKDIVFFPPACDEDIYLCLEAKRLNAMVSGKLRSLAEEYVTEGMRRFVDCKYSRRVRHGAMLGYVLDGKVERAMANVGENIRKRLTELGMDKGGGLTPSAIWPAEGRLRETRHRRAHERSLFRIHHFFAAAAA